MPSRLYPIQRKCSIKVQDMKRDTVKITAEDDGEDSIDSLTGQKKEEDLDDNFGSLLADCDDFFYPGAINKRRVGSSVDCRPTDDPLLEDDPMHEFM